MLKKILYSFCYLVKKGNTKKLKLSLNKKDIIIDTGLLIGPNKNNKCDEYYFIENNKFSNYNLKFFKTHIDFDNNILSYNDLNLLKFNSDIYLTLDNFSIYKFPKSFEELLKKYNLDFFASQMGLEEINFKLIIDNDKLYAFNVLKNIFYEIRLYDNILIFGDDIENSFIYYLVFQKKILFDEIYLTFENNKIFINYFYNNCILKLGYANLN